MATPDVSARRLTHASFFSGVGGLDMGLESAGWTTVSFSEIDPYASAVLARHWPAVPNLGDIVELDKRVRGPLRTEGDWTRADLWSGGFPCQDLSVAGKRRGMGTDTRSGLAYAFLDLVERYRPPAILLENVPGLLSSHKGRDFHALQRRMAELGYVGAYRILDARYFGVPQRRRRVFIVALDARRGATADDAAEVLSVGTRCDRHPATGGEAREGVADGTHVGTIPAGLGHHGNGGHSSQAVASGHVIPGIRPSPDPGGVRAPDGLAGWSHDRAGVAFVKSWREGDVAPTLNSFDVGDARATVAVLSPTINSNKTGGWYDADQAEGLQVGGAMGDDPLLPLGLDSHRYRCCGNGVVATVAEYIGERLAVVVTRLWD
jgi:site-specific DNA-cytosine methylase